MTHISEDDLRYDIATRAVHAGQEPDPTTGAIMTPIFQTSTYVQPRLGEHKGFEYARTRNPTRDALEKNLASLEGAPHGFAFSSGLAATEAILKLLSSGDHIVSGENLYGGSHRLMVQVLERFGLSFTFVDERDPANFERALTPATKLLYIETPTNPMMRLADLGAIADIAESRKLYFVVDNTFATPIFQRPLEHGANIVVHSTTKFLNGHSDIVGGAVLTSRDDVAERLAFLQNSAGAVPGPFDCWLALRGTKTLALRMKRHDENGRHIAQWLSENPRVTRVYYPGLRDHPQHELACSQMQGFGGMISFDMGSYEAARAVAEGTRLFSLAESLGGVESLIGHPATMTHASVPADLREAMGLTLGLVRISVGIEDADDLLSDLDHAMAAVVKRT